MPLARHRSARLDDAVAFRVHRTNRLLRTHLARFLETVAPGVSPEQWFILARLFDATDAVRQIDLAEPVLGDPPNVSRLVDTLVATDHVQRHPDPSDRRSSNLTLTVDGREVASRIHHAAIHERAAVFAGFSARELDQLVGLLDRLDANLRTLLSTTTAAPTTPTRRRALSERTEQTRSRRPAPRPTRNR